jgi:hypothetical protein
MRTGQETPDQLNDRRRLFTRSPHSSEIGAAGPRAWWVRKSRRDRPIHMQYVEDSNNYNVNTGYRR